MRNITPLKLPIKDLWGKMKLRSKNLLKPNTPTKRTSPNSILQWVKLLNNNLNILRIVNL